MIHLKITSMHREIDKTYLPDGLAGNYYLTEEYKIMDVIDNPIDELFWEFEWIIEEEMEELNANQK